MSPLRLRKPSEAATDAVLNRCDSLARIGHRRRWRLAFTVIYFTRALESMSKQVLGKKTDLLRSLSYVAIDVDLEHDGNLHTGGHPSLQDVDLEHDGNLHTGGHPSLQDVDLKMLSNMVREKRCIQKNSSQHR
ncbi:hypothetical protein NL676_020321 [Syzygium grande]|nr:hypothetical protein NL676_020321 [Syzygium grande]